MNAPSGTVEIANFGARWVDAAAELERTAGDAGWSRDQFAKELLLPFSRFFILTSGESLIGYGGFWKIEDEAQITNMVITPSYRRQGWGAKVLRTLLERAANEGCRRCTLEVRDANRAALGLYENMGFKRVGYRPGAYQRPVGDAVLMEKKL